MHPPTTGAVSVGSETGRGRPGGVYFVGGHLRNRVMRVLLQVALVVGLALGGLPHTFCLCGCADASQPTTASAGHDCCSGHADPTPDKPETCRCGTCEVVKAVAAGSQTSVPSLDLTSRVCPTAVVLSVRLVPADLPGEFSPAEPLGRIARSGCALPILLGHLLL